MQKSKFTPLHVVQRVIYILIDKDNMNKNSFARP